MSWQGHDALDLRVPIDVVSSAATRQEPSIPFESAPDSSSGGVHACRYLHDRPAEGQPAPAPRQDVADLVSGHAQAALAGMGRRRKGHVRVGVNLSLAGIAPGPRRHRTSADQSEQFVCNFWSTVQRRIQSNLIRQHGAIADNFIFRDFMPDRQDTGVTRSFQ